MNNEFSLSNVKGKNSFDSTTSSFKSKKASFRNQPSIINQIKNKNKNINALLKNNLSRNVKNLPICISQVTNLKNFHQLSTKLSPKENRNNSLISHSKETLFAKEDSFKDNNKIYSFKNRKQSNNMSFNKYISRNKNCLVINDLLLNLYVSSSGSTGVDLSSLVESYSVFISPYVSTLVVEDDLSDVPVICESSSINRRGLTLY